MNRKVGIKKRGEKRRTESLRDREKTFTFLNFSVTRCDFFPHLFTFVFNFKSSEL